MDTTASIARSTTRPLATHVSERHATNSVLVDLVAHLVIAFAIGLAASLALAGAVLMLSDDAPAPQPESYAVPANLPPGAPSPAAAG